MKGQAVERRGFLRTTAVGAAAFLWGSRGKVLAQGSTPIRIEEPSHGAVLNCRHGQEIAGGLKIRVAGQAPPGDRVTVNGMVAQREGSRFAAEVVLREKETEIVAALQDTGGPSEHRVRVVWDRHSFPRYRFSIDEPDRPPQWPCFIYPYTNCAVAAQALLAMMRVQCELKPLGNSWCS